MAESTWNYRLFHNRSNFLAAVMLRMILREFYYSSQLRNLVLVLTFLFAWLSPILCLKVVASVFGKDSKSFSHCSPVFDLRQPPQGQKLITDRFGQDCEYLQFLKMARNYEHAPWAAEHNLEFYDHKVNFAIISLSWNFIRPLKKEKKLNNQTNLFWSNKNE